VIILLLSLFVVVVTVLVVASVWGGCVALCVLVAVVASLQHNQQVPDTRQVFVRVWGSGFGLDQTVCLGLFGAQGTIFTKAGLH
jgi:hypothetical protein